MIENPSTSQATKAPVNGTPSTKTRIYVVDDHALIRQGIAQLISSEPDMTVCGEACDAAHAFNEIMKIVPDVVILDISLNGHSGLHLIKSIKSFDPDIAILVLSVHDEAIYGMRVLKAGARAYVMKGDSPNKLTDAIRRIRAGGIFVSNDLTSRILGGMQNGYTDGDVSPMSQLSDRELEIVDLIGHGYTTQELASRLYISIKTVETHRAHIKRKLQLENGTQLVHCCVRWVRESDDQPAG